MNAGLKFLLITILLTAFGCNESTTKKSSPSTTTNPVASSPEPTNLGPTGSSDPVDPDGVGAVDPVGEYPDEDPDDSPVLPGTAASKCGTAYRQANNPTLFFEENGNLFSLKEFSYDSFIFLNSFRFTEDSFSVCIDGYVNNGNFFINTTNSQVATTNPSRLFQNGEYPNEFCGQLAYLRSFSGGAPLTLNVGNRYYEIKVQNGVAIPSGIPSITGTITNTNSVEACVYSNSASYTEFTISSRPRIDAQAFDLGSLNQ